MPGTIFRRRRETVDELQGRAERRQLRQGQHRRAGRSQRAHGGDRALFRDFSGRRDPGDAAVHGFPAGRCHCSQRRPAVQRRAIRGKTGRRRRARTSETPSPPPFDPSAEIEWSPVWSLRDERFKYLPTSLLYFFYRGSARHPRRFQWLRGRQHARGSDRPGIPGAGGTRFIRDLVVQSTCSGRKWTSASSTIPTFAICKSSSPKPDAGFGCSTSPAISAFRSFVAMTHWMEDGQENIEFGSGAHFDARIAVVARDDGAEPIPVHGSHGRRHRGEIEPRRLAPLRLADHPYLTPNGDPMVQPEFGSKFGHLETREQVAACVSIVKRQGLDFLVLDQTRPDIEVPVVRVIVPGMRHFYRRFGPGRLYDVPVSSDCVTGRYRKASSIQFIPRRSISPFSAKRGRSCSATLRSETAT